jgi:sulfatase maturation enzyme AslB (radical SAM superfamily)
LLNLYITTNTTVKLTNELIQLITNTKKTIINCSIDAVGKLNDYIRSDSNWDEIESNIKTLLDISTSVKPTTQFIFNIDSVYNVFNAHCFNEILDWGMQYTQTVLPILQISPELQNARNLPDNYKNEIIQKYQTYIDNIQTYIDRFAKITAYKFRPKNFQYFANDYKALIGHLKNPPIIPSDEWKLTLKQHNDLLDKRRHIKLIDYNPRLASIINST